MKPVLSKKKICLAEYIVAAGVLSWDFHEDEDYIIFNDRRESHLELLIDKEMFFKRVAPDYKKGEALYQYAFFDMLKMWYHFPFAPWMDAISVRFGDFIEGDSGEPRFILREPKAAKHLLIYNARNFLFYGDDISVVNYAYQPNGVVVVPVDTKFIWKAKGVIHLSVDKDDKAVKQFVEESQRQFEKKLLDFYIYERRN